MFLKSVIIALTAFSISAQAYISEEIDDHKESKCFGDNLEFKINSENIMSGTMKDLQGKKYDIKGELTSLTINTVDSSLKYLVTLADNQFQFRYLTVDLEGGKGQAAIHYSISKVAGSLGTVYCIMDWNFP